MLDCRMIELDLFKHASLYVTRIVRVRVRSVDWWPSWHVIIAGLGLSWIFTGLGAIDHVRLGVLCGHQRLGAPGESVLIMHWSIICRHCPLESRGGGGGTLVPKVPFEHTVHWTPPVTRICGLGECAILCLITIKNGGVALAMAGGCMHALVACSPIIHPLYPVHIDHARPIQIVHCAIVFYLSRKSVRVCGLFAQIIGDYPAYQRLDLYAIGQGCAIPAPIECTNPSATLSMIDLGTRERVRGCTHIAGTRLLSAGSMPYRGNVRCVAKIRPPSASAFSKGFCTLFDWF